MKKEDEFNHNQFEHITNLIEYNKVKKCIKYIKSNNVNLAMAGNIIFKQCSAIGNLDFILYLLKQKEVTPYDNYNCALLHAATFNHVSLVKLFISQDSASANNNYNYIIESVFYRDKRVDLNRQIIDPDKKQKRLQILQILFSLPNVYNSLKQDNNLFLKIQNEIMPLLIKEKVESF